MLNKRKLLLSSLILLSSTLYAEGPKNSNEKKEPEKKLPAYVASTKTTNEKREKIETVGDSFNRKKIYKTKYFKIYYDKNSVKQAQELIRVADHIAETEAKLFKMDKIPKNVKVYVMDSQDSSNAFSTGYGIHLFITNNGGITNGYKNYIPYLFSHELTHEYLDYKIQDNGINRFIPFSDGIVKGAAISRWWTEGTAVLVESMISKGGGRTFDPGFIKIVKKDINEDKFTGLGPSVSKNKGYEYGNSFMRFYLETYGIDKVSEAIDYYASHKTFGIGQAFAKVAGVNGSELHDKWIAYLKNIVNEDAKGDLVEGPAIFDNHVWTEQVVKSGDAIWTYKIEKREAASTLAGHKRNKLEFVKIPFDEDGNPKYGEEKSYGAPTAIVYNQPAIKGNNIYYSSYSKTSSVSGTIDKVAYRYNVETGEQTLLKDLIRPDKFVNANGEIYYTYLEKGATGISRLNGQLVLAPSKYSISSLADAGDNRIVFTAKIEGEEGSKIFLLDTKTKKVTFLTNGSAGTVEDDTLYYTASYGRNVNNIYKMKIGDKKATRLTNVLYGATSPVVINKRLVYLNYTTNGNTITTLDIDKYSVNEIKPIATLEGEREAKIKKNSELYGEYGKAYNPEIKATVTVEELEKNEEKEVSGFYFPEFTKPSVTLGTSGVGLRFISANLNNYLTLSWEAKSVTNESVDLINADGPRADSKTTGWPLYYSLKTKGHKTDRYSGAYIHQFSNFSGATFSIFHTEYLRKGQYKGTYVDSRGVKSDNRSHSDEIILTIPFEIDSLDKSVYLTLHTQGDIFGTDSKGLKKLVNDKFTIEFGYDRYSSFIIGEAKTKFGVVIKGDTNSGAQDQNYFYVDRDIKSDIPYIRSLSFLKLRSRLYFAPKKFTDIQSARTDLTANQFGFTSQGGNTDDVKSIITNARFAAKVYGSLNYNIPVEKGTDFGMVYLKDVDFRLGYSAVTFLDEDYNDRDSTLSRWQSLFPKGYELSQQNSLKKLQSMTDDLTSQYMLEPEIRMTTAKYLLSSGLISGPTDPNLMKYYPLIAKTGAGFITLKSPQLTADILRVFNSDPATKKVVEKYKKKIMSVQNALYMKQHAPEKKKKIRTGFVVNPSVTLNGNLYADSLDFSLSVGNTYLADITNSYVDNDFWYLSAQIRF